MSKVIDATLRLVDRFSSPLSKAAENMKHRVGAMKREAKQIENAGKKIESFGKGLTAGITTPILAAGTASFKLASNMNESMSKTEVTFGKNANAMKKWSQTTLEQYGISQGAALEYASKYGDMASGMDLSKKEAVKLSKSITGLVGDLASFKNVSQSQADTALTGIFTGETESLKQLGIVMTQTNLAEFARNQGIKKDIKDMSQREKVMLRYNYVMSVTKNAQGDFNRTSGQAANQMRIAQEGVKQLATSFGNFLLPHVTKGIKYINNLISKFNGLDDNQKKTIVKIAGIAAAVGPAIMAFGKMVKWVGLAREGWEKFLLSMNKFGGISGMIMSPAGKVILVLSGIVAAAILVYKNWDKISSGAKKMQKELKKALNAAGIDTEKMKEDFKKFASSAKKIYQDFKGNIGKAKEVLEPFGKIVKEVFGKIAVVAFYAFSGVIASALHTAKNVIKNLITFFDGINSFISGVFSGNWEKAWNGVKKIFSGAFGALVSIAKAPLNSIIGMVNGVIAGLNKIKLPDWVPGVGGNGINIPTIPMLAKGTKNWAGGLVQVHEKGGEIIDLPRGTRVYPHDESVRMAKKDGVKNISIAKIADTIVVREEADIDKIAKKLAEELEKIPA